MSAIKSSVPQIPTTQPIGVDNAPKRNPGAFDPAKAARNAQIQPQHGPDPFSEAIKEATDGDSSEAEARSALGLANDDEKNKKADNDRLLDKARGAAGAQLPANGVSEKDGNSALQVGNLARKEAAAAALADSESVSTVEVANLKVADRHEQLMLLSGSMGREQTATHIAQEAADKIETLQRNQMWTRDSEKSDNLNATQMAFVGNVPKDVETLI